MAGESGDAAWESRDWLKSALGDAYHITSVHPTTGEGSSFSPACYERCNPEDATRKLGNYALGSNAVQDKQISDRLMQGDEVIVPVTVTCTGPYWDAHRKATMCPAQCVEFHTDTAVTLNSRRPPEEPPAQGQLF